MCIRDRIGAGPLGERYVKHRKVEVAGLQRAFRRLDRINCNDIANFAERVSHGIVFVDVKNSRTSVRLVHDGLGKQPHQAVKVHRLVQPIHDIELGRPQVVAPAAGIGGYNDDRCVAILRQRAQAHDQTDAVAIRQLDIHQNSAILSCHHARERVAYRIGEVRGKSDLPQLLAQRERRIEIVFTKQQPRRIRFRIAIDRQAGHMIPAGQLDVKDRSAAGSIGEAHFATEPVDDLLDDAQTKACLLYTSRCV